MITENVKELSKTIELPGEKRLDMVVEGRPPACYGCGQKCDIKEIKKEVISQVG